MILSCITRLWHSKLLGTSTKTSTYAKETVSPRHIQSTKLFYPGLWDLILEPLECYAVVLFCSHIIQYQFPAMLIKKEKHINCLRVKKQPCIKTSKDDILATGYQDSLWKYGHLQYSFPLQGLLGWTLIWKKAGSLFICVRTNYYHRRPRALTLVWSRHCHLRRNQQ